MTESVVVACEKCGAERDPAIAGLAQKPPCPECGATRVKIALGLVEIMPPVVDSAQITLTAAEQDRGWRERWTAIQSAMATVEQRRTDPLSPDAVQAAHHDLQSFFIQAYHLKDILVRDASMLGLTANQIETAVTNTPALALLADLANLDKHGGLTKRPRSGHVLKISGVSGTQRDNDGWRLSVHINHNGKIVDGVTFARVAVASWHSCLKQWGLL